MLLKISLNDLSNPKNRKDPQKGLRNPSKSHINDIKSQKSLNNRFLSRKNPNQNLQDP